MTWNYRSAWRFIGNELGVDSTTLDAIDADHKTAADCLTSLLKHWLYGDKILPTRSALTKALQSQSVVDAYEGKFILWSFARLSGIFKEPIRSDEEFFS